jgi:hypothetical protein
MPRDTGFPRADAEYDFLRARRRAVLSRLGGWLRREPDDVNIMLPFDEVADALGRLGEQRVGNQVIPLHAIVGSVDRQTEFDRQFRPMSARVRERFERLALAVRRGESVPPIEVYRVGELYFVSDGHHRVAVAHALGWTAIEASVIDVRTKIDPGGIEFRDDLMIKNDRRLFLDRVPLAGDAMPHVVLTDPWRYTELAEAVEAWGFRLMQEEGAYFDRTAIARRWFGEEFRPVIELMREAELIGRRTDAEAYLAVSCRRYALMRTHSWDDDVIAKLREDG